MILEWFCPPGGQLNIERVLLVAGLAAAIILGTVSILLVIWFRKVKRPRYMIRNQQLIEDFSSRYPDLEVTHKGRPVANVTVSRIAFWNAGNETIQADDIAAKDPPRIAVPEGFEILNHSLAGVSKPANGIKVRANAARQCVDICFDYLDKNDGAVVEIIHTCVFTDEFKLLGSIKGAGGFKKQRQTHVHYLSHIIFAVGVLLLGVVTIIDRSPLSHRALLMMLFVVGMFIGMWRVYRATRSTWRDVPMSLQKWVEQTGP